MPFSFSSLSLALFIYLVARQTEPLISFDPLKTNDCLQTAKPPFDHPKKIWLLFIFDFFGVGSEHGKCCVEESTHFSPFLLEHFQSIFVHQIGGDAYSASEKTGQNGIILLRRLLF